MLWLPASYISVSTPLWGWWEPPIYGVFGVLLGHSHPGRPQVAMLDTRGLGEPALALDLDP